MKGEGQHISAIKLEVLQMIMKSMVIWSTEERNITMKANLMTLLKIAVHQVIVTAMTAAIIIPKGTTIIHTWMGLVLTKEIK